MYHIDHAIGTECNLIAAMADPTGRCENDLAFVEPVVAYRPESIERLRIIGVSKQVFTNKQSTAKVGV